jgi:hypothetical protein
VRLRCVPVRRGLRRRAAGPSRSRVRVIRNRQGLPPVVPLREKLCGWRMGGAICLTGFTRPVHFAFDSGGRPRERSRDLQTGNSGANPGRPRRCDQATRSAASGHCGMRERRACPREGMRPTKSGSQKTYQVSWVRRTARAGRRTRSPAAVCVFDSSPQERDAVRPRGRFEAARAPGHRLAWPHQSTSPTPVEA